MSTTSCSPLSRRFPPAKRTADKTDSCKITPVLIATERSVYTWKSPPAGEPDPVEIEPVGTVRAFAQHAHFGLIAIDDHVVVHRGAEHRDFRLGLDEPITALLILSLMPLRALIGTKGAHLYEFSEESGRANLIESFDQLACREQ